MFVLKQWCYELGTSRPSVYVICNEQQLIQKKKIAGVFGEKLRYQQIKKNEKKYVMKASMKHQMNG